MFWNGKEKLGAGSRCVPVQHLGDLLRQTGVRLGGQFPRSIASSNDFVPRQNLHSAMKTLRLPSRIKMSVFPEASKVSPVACQPEGCPPSLTALDSPAVSFGEVSP